MKRMFDSSIINQLQDLLTDKQIILYINGLLSADTLGILAGKSWVRMTGATDEDLYELLDHDFVIEIKQKRGVAYVIKDWWIHNQLPKMVMRKTSMPEVLEQLYVDNRVYNIDGKGVPASDFLRMTDEQADEETPEKKQRQKKEKEPKDNPLYEEIVTLWNSSYPDKPAPRHKPGTKIYDGILSSIIYAGEDVARAAAQHAGAEMQIEPWFNFDAIFSDAEKIQKLKNGNYDRAFGHTALKLEYQKRQAEQCRELTEEEKLAKLGFN